MSTQQKTPTLGEKISLIATLMKDAATGPLRAAGHVVELSENWEARGYKKETGDDFATYLRKHLGPKVNVRFFQQRHAAVKHYKLDRAIMLDHQAVVWLFGKNIGAAAEDTLLLKVAKEFVAQNRNPLSQAQLLRVYRQIFKVVPTRPKNCQTCREKDAEIQRLKAMLTGGKKTSGQ